MSEVGQATVFEGHLTDLPKGASAGIRWLKSFWTSLDSLNVASTPPLSAVVAPDCQFIINGGSPQGLDHLQQAFQQRAVLLSRFGHTQ